MDAVKVGRSRMKALSSDVRLNILKQLEEKQKTQTDLAELFHLKVPTIKGHLDVLQKEGLVEKREEGRKWKYYHLTEEGKALLNPDTKIIKLLLFSFGGFTLASIITALLNSGTTIKSTQESAVALRAESADAVAAAPMIQEGVRESINIFPILTGLFIVLALISLGLVLYYKYKKR